MKKLLLFCCFFVSSETKGKGFSFCGKPKKQTIKLLFSLRIRSKGNAFSAFELFFFCSSQARGKPFCFQQNWDKDVSKMENKQFCKRVISVAEFKRFLLCFGKGRKNTSSHCGSSSKFFQEKESKRTQGFKKRIQQFWSQLFWRKKNRRKSKFWKKSRTI